MALAIHRLASDVGHGWRVFSRQRLRAAIAVVTLSLAVGANAAIFSVLYAVILRPFPFPDAGRMMLVVDRTRSSGQTSPTIPELLDLRARSRTLDVVTFFDTRDFQVNGGHEPVRVLGARVDPAFLPLVGARPEHGRLLRETDSAEGSPAVILLSDALWRRNFGADPNVVGRSLVVDGETRMIAGVVPRAFSLGFLSGEPPELYVPYPLTRDYTLRTAEFANVRRVTAVARMAPHASPAAATAELARIAADLAAEHPAIYSEFAGSGSSFAMDVQPLRESIGAGTRSTLWMLFGAVALVLLIGCLNAAQFLLAQAIEREPEVSLRGALGASRGRLVTQFLSETAVLAIAAACLGILQAMWLVQVLRSLFPSGRMVGQIELDIPVLAFAAAVAVVTTLLCGVLPALRFSRINLRASLSLDARGAGACPGRSRQVLVAMQVAVSVVLLIQAALLMRTLQTLQGSQSGFLADSVTVMRMRGMSSGSSLGLTYAQFLERISSTPGVAASAMSSSALPGRPGTPFTVIRSTVDQMTKSNQNASYQIISPDYFSVLRISLREGRTFQPTDTVSAPRVAIINEEMARRFWPGQSAIGQQIRSGIGPREATMTIVGVAGNVRTMVQGADVPQIYASYLQQPEPNMVLLVRPRAGPVPIDPVKRAIWSVEPSQAVFGVRPLDDLLSQSVQAQRVMTRLIGSFAVLALVMSMAGVFGVVSYLTARRQKEVAVRRAIGAQNTDVLWLLGGQTLRWTLAGLVAGVGGAVIASRVLRANVTGLADLDPATVAMASAGYLLVAAGAMILPAMRALRANPADTLRAE